MERPSVEPGAGGLLERLRLFVAQGAPPRPAGPADPSRTPAAEPRAAHEPLPARTSPLKWPMPVRLGDPTRSPSRTDRAAGRARPDRRSAAVGPARASCPKI